MDIAYDKGKNGISRIVDTHLVNLKDKRKTTNKRMFLRGAGMF
jgi:hypothetical protein